MRAIGSCDVVPRRRLRAGRPRAGRARQGLVHAAADAQQRAHHGRRVLLRDPRRRARGRARLRPGARGVRQADRRVPGPPALHRRHRDVARPGRADGLQRGVAAVSRASRATWSRPWPRSWPPSARSRPPTSASRSSAAWATRPRPTCSATGATRGCGRSARSPTRWRATRSPSSLDPMMSSAATG